MSMKQKIFYAAVSLTLSQNIFAQNDSLKTNQLNEVVVTATKYPKKSSETGKVITVITREQLDRSSGKDLAQLLNEQAGISVNGANSNLAKDKTIYLRGASPQYTLITIDGVPVYDASGVNSNFDFRQIPIDIIDRIEILKGSQSTLYGADAIAGVINIITKKNGNKIFSPFTTFTYGSYNTVKLNAGVNGNKDFFNYNIAYTYNKSDGISEAADKTSTGTFDKDGFDQNAFIANLGFKISKNLKISPYLRYGKYNSDLDADAFTDDKDYTSRLKNLQAGVKNEFSIGKAKLSLLYNYNHVVRNYLNDSSIKETPLDGYMKGDYTGNEHFIDAYVTSPVTTSITFTVGVDYRNSKTDVNTFGVYKYLYDNVVYSGTYESNISKDSATQTQVGVYGELNYAGKAGFNAAVGGRYNHHSVYGSNAVFNVNPSYLINKQLKLFINISSGYKVPTLYQLYSEYRNPFTELKPEQALTYEIGAQFFSSKNLFTARVAAFKRDIKDVIAFYTNPNTYASYYINQDKQKDYGFEIEPTINLKRAQLILSYSFVDGKITTKNSGKDSSYFNLFRRPKNIVNATLNYHITKKLFASASVISTGKRTDIDFSIYPAENVELSAYWLVNFYAEYKFCKSFKAFIDLKNLTNTSYSELLGYNTLGRKYTLGVAVHF